MIINERTYEITTSYRDFGIPINFEAGIEEGFAINDVIVFCFENHYIPNKIFTVDREDFTFELVIKKEEADNLSMSTLTMPTIIKYSIKRYRDNQFLETLVDSTLKIVDTIEWDGELENGEIESS